MKEVNGKILEQLALFESGDPEAEYYLLEYEPGPPEPEPEDWPDEPFILDDEMTPIDWEGVER